MLYQQARPKKLGEVVGNEKALFLLRDQLKADIHSHCFLLYGPSGCGKTTIARILAAEFGCLDMNVVEMNAANERGIDTIRDLERSSQFSPMGGGNRAIIIDECHMLTREAQNASLKLLEDIPEYQYYLLCTTEPNKLLKTIRTRATHVGVSELDAEGIGFVLDDACIRLGLDELDNKVVTAIINHAAGCPRVALTLLESVVGKSPEDALEKVATYQSRETQTIELCRALLKNNWQNVVRVYTGLMAEDSDVESLRRMCLGYLHSCLAKDVGDMALRFACMIEALAGHTYDSGKAGLLAKLWRAWEFS